MAVVCKVFSDSKTFCGHLIFDNGKGKIILVECNQNQCLRSELAQCDLKREKTVGIRRLNVILFGFLIWESTRGLGSSHKFLFFFFFFFCEVLAQGLNTKQPLKEAIHNSNPHKNRASLETQACMQREAADGGWMVRGAPWDFHIFMERVRRRLRLVQKSAEEKEVWLSSVFVILNDPIK